MRFPDCTQLEKTFPSSGKIRSVYAFVRDSLREDVKPIKFVLCASDIYLSTHPPIHPIFVFNFILGAHARPPSVQFVASSPPPRDLKVSDPTVRDLTLAELGLAPSSVLHFRFIDDELNRAYYPPSLSYFLFHPIRFPPPPSEIGPD